MSNSCVTLGGGFRIGRMYPAPKKSNWLPLVAVLCVAAGGGIVAFVALREPDKAAIPAIVAPKPSAAPKAITAKLDSTHEAAHKIVLQQIDDPTVAEEVVYQVLPRTDAPPVVYLSVRSKSKFGGLEVSEWVIWFLDDPVKIKEPRSLIYRPGQEGFSNIKGMIQVQALQHP